MDLEIGKYPQRISATLEELHLGQFNFPPSNTHADSYHSMKSNHRWHYNTYRPVVPAKTEIYRYFCA